MSGGLNPGQQSLRQYPTIHQPNHNTLTFHYVSLLWKPLAISFT